TALFAGVGPPVTAMKGTTGHLVAGSGAVEAILTLESLADRILPPVAGLRQLDQRIDLDVVRSEPRTVELLRLWRPQHGPRPERGSGLALIRSSCWRVRGAGVSPSCREQS